MNKNKPSTSARSSFAIENGHINSSTIKSPNDEIKRTSQQHTDNFHTPSQYGKTLSVPDTNVLSVLPTITPPAPINPPRPAIMTTPKSATTAKTSTNDLRPTLLVTTVNDQQKPQTVTIPNGRKLPLNGRIATITPTKQRQQPNVPIITRSHQMINETIQKKPINTTRPRTALYIPATSNFLVFLFCCL